MISKFFCLSLKTAGLVIGWIGAGLSLILILVFALLLGFSGDIAEALAQQMKSVDMTAKDVQPIIIIICSIFIVMSSIDLVVSGLLIVGTSKERHLLLLPWLIYSAISLALRLPYFFYLTTTLYTQPKELFPPLIFSGIGFALNLYIWCAIYSLFKQLQAGRDQQQHVVAPITADAYPTSNKI